MGPVVRTLYLFRNVLLKFAKLTCDYFRFSTNEKKSFEKCVILADCMRSAWSACACCAGAQSDRVGVSYHN